MSPYFEERTEEMTAYYCPNCEAWYRTLPGWENASCTVLHSPGSCCHFGEEQTIAPTTPPTETET